MIQLTIKYNDHLKSVHFPCSEKELIATLTEIHAYDDKPTTLFVTEIEYPEEFQFLTDTFVNLDEINYLAKRLDSFCAYEYEQYFEAMKYERITEIKDLINLTFNLNRYPLIQDISDMGKIGREYLLNRDGCIPANDNDNSKYAEIGRKLIQSGEGVFTEHGLLFADNAIPFKAEYDGQVFPPYIYDANAMLIAKAEYNGKAEYITIPCETEAIWKVFSRLGADNNENVKITLENLNFQNSDWFERIQNIADEEGIKTVNDFLGVISKSNVDLVKLWFLAEYASAEDTEELIKLAESIDDFVYIQYAEDYEYVGRYMTESYDEYRVNSEIENFFNFEKFGEYIADKNQGKFVSGGFIFNTSNRTLNQILYENSNIALGGM